MREIGRTSANGQKAYVNDPDNERRPRGVESQRESERGLRVSLIKVMVKGMGERERERETFLTACCFWIEQRANEKWR